MTKTWLIFLTTLTPLHAGGEAEANSPVDLPVQREKHTGFPTVYGSSLKGVLRSTVERTKDKEKAMKIFGSQEEIGKVSVTDARILLFPIRMLNGTFAWITSPFVLNRFLRDVEYGGISEEQLGKVREALTTLQKQSFQELSDDKALVSDDFPTEKLFLEEFSFTPSRFSGVGDLAHALAHLTKLSLWSEVELRKKMVILSDAMFAHLVRTATLITPRVRINPQSGTVEKGGFWMEEYVPPEVLFYALLFLKDAEGDEEGEEILKKLFSSTLQFGGNETIGKGFVRLSTPLVSNNRGEA